MYGVLVSFCTSSSVVCLHFGLVRLIYYLHQVLLLAGFLSFMIIFVETEKGIFDAILNEEVDFDSQPWPSISNSAKDLVRKMLNKDPRRRITSAQVLGNLLYF